MPPRANKILQIVPRIFPDVDGVGDYTLMLAHQLYDRYQILSDFLVFRPSSRTQFQIDRFQVYPLTTHTVDGLLTQIPADVSTIVLQYSNYPYLLGKLDAPNWLVLALRILKYRGFRICIMFHELPTLQYRQIRLPNPIQRRISRQLAQIADLVVTNNNAFQQTLAGWSKNPVLCIPNFSTIGEPETILPLSARSRSLIVFGSSDRRRVYRNNIYQLKQVCQQLKIEVLYDIGRPLDWDFESLEAEVKVIQTGFLSAYEVSQLMLQSLAGIFDYHRFPNNLAKSTVFAAYCAHGVLPLCNRRSLPPQDGIIPNQHYLDFTTLSRLCQQTSSFLPSLQIIADNAHTHYCAHRLAKCANFFASSIEPVLLN